MSNSLSDTEIMDLPKEPGLAYDHAVTFYGLLHDAAKDEDLPGDRKVRVFRGKVVELFRSMGVSHSYYSSVRRILVDTGSVRILQQGARNSPTVIVLFKPPEKDDVSALLSQSIDLTKKVDTATISQRIDDLHEQIGSIRIVDAFLDVETRLKGLEEDVAELKRILIRLEQPSPKPQRRTV